MLEKDHKIPELDSWLNENKDLINTIKKEKKHSINIQIDFEPATFDIDNLDHIEVEKEFWYKSEGTKTKILEKLRKTKKNEFNYIIDFHGLTKKQAKLNLDKLLKLCLEKNYRKLKVIFGKGHHSSKNPELVKIVISYCIKSRYIKAACSAKKNDGGIGVIYIQLV